MTDNKKYVELIWAGKYDKYKKGEKIPIEKPNLPLIEKPNLPFQTIETINEPRMKEYEDTFGREFYPENEYPEGYPKDWKNKLIWGDNKLVMSSLIKQGWAGKINLIYIDPPFFTGADFTVRTKLGDEKIEKEPSIIEERAYKDTWSGGIASYLKYMHERLVLMRELLAENEIFGAENFRNEIIWNYVSGGISQKAFARKHDLIYLSTKSENYLLNYLKQRKKKYADIDLAECLEDDKGKFI